MNGPRRAVIFDLDGTLLDTLQDLACSVNYALEQFGLRQRSVAEIRRFLGNGVRNLMGLSVPAGLSADQFERVLETFRAHYLLHCYDHTAPYPGVESVLQALKQRGYALAIVSNKVDEAVKALNQRYFQGLIPVAIGEKEGILKKPAPDTVLTALQELGCTNGAAVYVGDSEVDLQTARNCAMACITATWGFRDEAELVAAGASMLARKPVEILQYV